ncbi:MAG: hypothetical protein M0R70_11750 [Nitrospirae bacterium]|nr:hypothetical protein [Nitrospirota bacterium]
MKKYFVAILVLVIIATVAFFGCEKKQSVSPPSSKPAVTPLPTPAPATAPAPIPAPAKPAKK